MPKRPKLIHPLRLLRMALDLNQKEMATRLGISESYVNQIECSNKDVPKPVADIVLATFGVPIGQAAAAFPDDAPGTLFSVLFMLHYITPFEELAGLLNRDAASTFMHRFEPHLLALVRAAAKHGRAISLLLSLQRWIEEMVGVGTTEGVMGAAVKAAYEAEMKEPVGYFDPDRHDVRVAFTPLIEEQYWGAVEAHWRRLMDIPKAAPHILRMARRAGCKGDTVEEIMIECVRSIERRNSAHTAEDASKKLSPEEVVAASQVLSYSDLSPEGTFARELERSDLMSALEAHGKAAERRLIRSEVRTDAALEEAAPLLGKHIEQEFTREEIENDWVPAAAPVVTPLPKKEKKLIFLNAEEAHKEREAEKRRLEQRKQKRSRTLKARIPETAPTSESEAKAPTR